MTQPRPLARESDTMSAMTTDPLDTSGGVPFAALADPRATCPVSRTSSGAYFLARYETSSPP